MRTLLSRIRALFLRRVLDDRLDEEIQGHLDALAADYQRRGMNPEEARRAARREFGAIEPMKDVHRERRAFSLLTDCVRDARFGLRLLARERWFTAAAVLVLSLGIAANNTVFVLVNGFLLRDMPFADPDRIVTIGTRVGGARAGISYLDLQDWSAAERTLDGLAAASETTMNVGDETRVPERTIGSYISANAFDLIGHAPVLGRGFNARDDRPGADAVVLLSDALWRNRYGADRAVIGRTIRVNGVQAVVIGVMAGDFAFPGRSRVWMPLSQLSAASRDRRDARMLQGIGKLSPSITPAQAASDFDRLLATVDPTANRDVRPRIELFRWGILGGRFRETLPILLMMVGVVLLIACANVANLLLARAAYRTREISVRIAVGASRAQIVRQLLVESVLLAGMAGAVALWLSHLAVNVFWDAMSQIRDGVREGMPYWVTFEMDWRVFIFLALVCLGTGIVFGLIPALDASRAGIVGRLVQAATGYTGTMRQRRWTTRLVVAQLALTPMLLAGAGLMVRSIIAQQAMDPGVSTAGLVRMRFALSGPKYEMDAQRARFYRELEDRLVGVPGMQVTLASHAPFEGAFVQRLSIDGRPAGGGRDGLVNLVTVGREYFSTLAAPPLRGSGFAAVDDGRAVATAIVNEQFAAIHFANREPIGHRLELADRDGRRLDAEIVGVVPDIRQRSTEAQERPEPIVYLTYAANPIAQASVLARSNIAPGAVAALVGSHLRAIDPDLPLYDVMTLDESLALSDERMGLRVFGTIITCIGVIAILLSTLGLYAATAYATAQRTREFGIRVALGSRPAQIGWLVAARAARHLAIGLSIGMAGALGVNQLMRGVLVGIGATDFGTLGGVAFLLIVVTGVASALPVTRAMRLNPAAVLRNE
jgi:putative ABC transport system permease protein